MDGMIRDLVPVESTVIERQDFGGGWLGEVTEDTYRNGRVACRTTILFDFGRADGLSSGSVLGAQFDTREEAAVALMEMLPKAFDEGLTVTTEGDTTIIKGEGIYVEQRGDSFSGRYVYLPYKKAED
jgi:hypothetical protein